MLGKRKAQVYVQVPPRVRPRLTTPQYDPVGDEITESGEVRIHGETLPDEDEDEDEVPVRTLDDFAIFNSTSREFVMFDELLAAREQEDYVIVGAGVVGAFVEDDSDDEDEEDMDMEAGPCDNDQRLLLSEIIECDAHFVTKHHDGWEFNPRTYLRTQHAWYILFRPSAAYKKFYQAAWTRRRIVQGLLTTINEDTDASVSKVLHSINRAPPHDCPTRPAFDDLHAPVSDGDMIADDTVSYLILVFDKLHSEHARLHRRLTKSTVMQTLYPALSTRKPLPPPQRKSCKRHRDLEKQVLEHRNPTCVTPRVNAIAAKLFSASMQVADIREELNDTTTPPLQKRQVHVSDPATIEWVMESRTAPLHYSEVKIDGELYKVGDVVMVEPGQDEDRARARNALSIQARSDNYLADTKWFCIISYMFEKISKSGRRTKHFHAQWLQHGSQTLLQEAAHPRGLFRLNECGDQPLECIYSHCDPQAWPLGEPAPPETQSGSDNHFHLGLTWDSKECALVEVSASQVSHALSKCESTRQCVPCGFAALRKEAECCLLLPDGGVKCNGVDFHVNDFVYLHTPGQVAGLLGIAQITEFIHSDGQCLEASVVHYGRYDAVAVSDNDGWPIPLDNRRLFQTSVLTKVSIEQICGKAYVMCPSSAWEAEAFVQMDDHFYCDLQSESLKPESLDELEVLEPSGFSSCDACYSAFMDDVLERERLMKLYGPLRGLELFAGAGGLSTGLDMSGTVQTRWAVEFSPSAARTYKANHPNTVVYSQCSNKLLEHAIGSAQGSTIQPLRSLDPKVSEPLPPLPQPGEVDFIYGGPPCQSFSLMNHHRKANDVRSTLVCNMISYVEYYRPMFFLLENVVGMLSYRLGGEQKDNRVVGGIEMGVVKFILGSLTTLGYQVQFKVLQAGQHGAPQGRRRVIFLGARRDVPLPAFPLPQYAFQTPVHNVNLPTGEVLHPVVRVGADEGGHQCAPLLPVTVREAISDLPRYDWIDPNSAKRSTPSVLHELGSRIALGIARFTACAPKHTQEAQPSGFCNPAPYPQPPLSRYQSWLRAGNGDTVLYHYTKWFSRLVVERVVNIPMKPNAGHEDLPLELRELHLYNKQTGKPKPNYRSMYGRIPGEGQFVTAMTTIAPNAKGGKVLHPDQKRILTIRECARAQGFPDTYQFISVNKKSNDCVADQMRQVGNAVPVPLALSLGKAVGNALYELWRSREEQEQAWRANSPEVHLT